MFVDKLTLIFLPLCILCVIITQLSYYYEKASRSSSVSCHFKRKSQALIKENCINRMKISEYHSLEEKFFRYPGSKQVYKFFILICRVSVKPCRSYHFDIIWIMPHHSAGHMHSCAYFTLVTALSQNNKKNIEAVPFVSPSAL